MFGELFFGFHQDTCEKGQATYQHDRYIYIYIYPEGISA